MILAQVTKIKMKKIFIGAEHIKDQLFRASTSVAANYADPPLLLIFSFLSFLYFL